MTEKTEQAMKVDVDLVRQLAELLDATALAADAAALEEVFRLHRMFREGRHGGKRLRAHTSPPARLAQPVHDLGGHALDVTGERIRRCLGEDGSGKSQEGRGKSGGTHVDGDSRALRLPSAHRTR